MIALRKEWIEPAPPVLRPEVIAVCGGDEFLAAILSQRGLTDAAKIRGFLDPDNYNPAPPEQLPDLVLTSTLIQDAISSKKKILIWGDFDVDGQTATALLADGLQRLNANYVYYIPNRATESHGIRLESLDRELAKHQPQLLLTCDTGITEYESIDHARSLGLTVLITDHHDLGDHLPNATAIVNPKRLPHGHPLGSLPGVGVAYKLMQHLFVHYGRERELPNLLDLVALGIVADVAQQMADTRYLLQIGLEKLRHTGRIGLQAIFEVAKLNIDTLSADAIGFQIGPRLNAVGRLADATLAVELLLTRDRSKAALIAQQLEGYNNERKLQTRQIEQAADQLLQDDPTLLQSKALVLYGPKWNAGLLGLVASRLAERYGRPAVLLSGGGDNIARGSARSVAGYNISAAIASVATLLIRYGGHPGAAGLSLEASKIDAFRRQLSRALAEQNPTTDVPQMRIDAVVKLEELSLDLAKRIQKLAPFGEGNPAIILATSNVHLAHSAMIGRDEQHRKLYVQDEEGHQQSVLWWQSAKELLPGGRFDIAYSLGTGSRQEIEVTLIDWRQRESAAELATVSTIQILDWRKEPNPLTRLKSILASTGEDCLVWAEAYSRQQYPDWKRRAELSPASTLVIWTAPSDAQTLQAAITTVSPKTIHVFGLEPPINDFEGFIKQLTTATRNVIEHLDGQVEIDILCGAVAQSRQVVRIGLEFLAAQGKILLKGDQNGQALKISSGTNGHNIISSAASLESQNSYQRRLQTALDEAAAYRRFFHKMAIDRLVTP